MKYVEAFLLACLLSLDGCAGIEPGEYPNLWTQCVEMKAYGLNGATMWGPITLGYISWKRNINCGKDQPS